MAGIKINQYPLERLTFGDDDYYDIDYWNGTAFETAKIKGSVIKLAIQAGIVSNNLFTADLNLLADRDHTITDKELKFSINDNHPTLPTTGSFKLKSTGIISVLQNTDATSVNSQSNASFALSVDEGIYLTTFVILGGRIYVGNGNNSFDFDAVNKITSITGTNGDIQIGDPTNGTNTFYRDLTPTKYGVLYKNFGETSETDATGANYATLVGTSLVPKKYVDDAIASSPASNISNSDLTQTDLNRIYTRSPISGTSRLRFQGTNHILTMEDSSTIVMYSSKYDTGGTAIPTTALSGSKLEFNGGTCRIQGAGSELRLHGYYNTTIESKINLSADLEITSKSTRKTIMNANILRWESSDSVTHYGNINNGKFIWATGTGFLPPTVVGSEGVSLQKDTLVKGSDNSASTSGFKVTDINDNSLLDIKNNGKISTNGSNVDSSFNVKWNGVNNNVFTVTNGNNLIHAFSYQNYEMRNWNSTQTIFQVNDVSGVPKISLFNAGTEIFRIKSDGTSFLNSGFALNGKDSLSSSSGFKVTDVNNNSLLDVRNNGSLKLEYLPSLSTGVGSGDVWSQNGTLRIGSATANIQTVASATTLTPNADTTKMEIVTGLASALTIASPTGTPTEAQELTFRIKDNGTAYGLTWNAIFTDYTGLLPTTTTAGKTVYIGCKYNAVDTKWDVVAVQVQP